nr:RNA-directed DNA polymerase, eukaryota [Tanacetum cinerariifolium]
MGTYKSKEDDVAKISTTVYVTNFPESISAKELFHSCKVFGHVVDSFIPIKRAKNGDEDVVKSPTVVLDDVCLMTRDLSNAILGRVNEFASLANLKMALCNEGFVDIKIQYLGEFWVMMVFANKEMIKKFRDNTEGIPFKLWTGYTFKHIAAKWGEHLDVNDQEDSCFHSKRLCIHTKLERSISKEFKIIHRGKIYWIRAKETPGWVSDFSEESDDEDLDEGDNNLEEGELKGNAEYSYDPFNIYPMLNKKVEKGGCDNKSEGSLKYPPGFSPKECNEDNFVHAGADIYLNEDGNASNKSKRAEGIAPRTGGSILGLLDEVVKVVQIIGYKMKGCMSNMAEIIEVQGAKERCWGNLTFDYVHSATVGNSGGILSVWDPNCFCKENVTMSDSFVMVSGVWRSTGQKYMLIAVYAPHDTKDKHMLWDYLQREIRRWKGEFVVIGDFNKVRHKSECFGSVFNVHEANMFNSFIMNSGLVEVNLGGCSFTWCHKSASKMSKMDIFLILDSLVNTCPNINAITLERYISDHRSILLREAYFDYGPISFKIFHYWFKMDGFNKMVEDAWKEYPGKESNAIRYFMAKAQYKNDLVSIEDITDRGDRDGEVIGKRVDIINKLHDINTIQSMEMAQKTKIRWAVEGDKNSSFFMILDGPFILNEVIQWCKSKHKQALIFKVDFKKAYDSVRWDFLDDDLRKFGFGDKWCKIIGVHVDGNMVKSVAGKLGKKVTWVNWKEALLSKERGRLGVSSLYAMNRGLLFEWIWRFCTQVNTLWARIIKAIHGVDGRIGVNSREMGNPWRSRKTSGVMKVRLRIGFREFMLLSRASISWLRQSFLSQLCRILSEDNREIWGLENTGEFSVASIRRLIDDKMLSSLECKTRWINYVPIKVNVHAWKVMMNLLPTRFNISRRGISIDSILYANCDTGVETSRHLFFSCCMAREVMKLIARWWNVPESDFDSYEEWLDWFANVRLPLKNKKMLEGVFYVLWWLLWWFHNKTIFEVKGLAKFSSV